MKNLVLLTALILSVFSTNLNGQAEAFAATEAVNSIVDNLKDRISEIIDKLDGVVTRQAFDMRQHLMIVLNELDWIVEKNIEKTFEEIEDEQRRLLQNINSSLLEIERTGGATIEKLDDLVNKSVAFAGTLPGSKKKPTVTKLSPSYMIVDSSSNLVVKVKGSWLAHGTPYIKIGNLIYEPIQKIDSELSFDLPFDLLFNQNKEKFLKADLIVFHKKFLKTKKINYKIGITLLPPQLGEYEIYIKTKESKTVTVKRSEKFSVSNGHCEGGRDFYWTFNAKKGGWEIVPNSIKIDKKLHVSTKSRFHGTRNVGDKAFQIHARVENNGSCIRKWGVTVARDGRGSVNGKVSWKESKVIPEIKDFGEYTSGFLYWDDDVSIDLPENLHSFRFELKQINGKKSILTESGNESWFQVQFNKSSKELIIKPRKPEDALR